MSNSIRSALEVNERCLGFQISSGSLALKRAWSSSGDIGSGLPKNTLNHTGTSFVCPLSCLASNEVVVDVVWLEARLHWRELDDVPFLGLWIGRSGVAMLPFLFVYADREPRETRGSRDCCLSILKKRVWSVYSE